MFVSFDELNKQYLPSGRLWKGFAPPLALGPAGSMCLDQSGNPAFGFFDHFTSFQASTLEGPYLILEGTGCSVEQVASSADTKGVVRLAIDGNADNDEVVLQHGRGLDAQFKLADNDLVFEACFSLSAVTAAKWDFAVGLGEVGMGASDALFTDGGALADKNFCGFVKLAAESTALDAAYKADGQTYQNGATKTKLDSLATLAADTMVKVGFRYQAHPRLLEFYVDNALPGGNVTPARLLKSELDAATFPDDVFLAPIIGAKDQAGDTALNVDLDWWSCAQYLG